MKKIFLSIVVFLCLFIYCSLTYAATTAPPSSVTILKSLQELQGPSSSSGKRGPIRLVLGLHRLNSQDSYTVYYCTAKPKKGDLFSPEQQDGCFNDATLHLLDSGQWALHSADRTWLLVNAPLY